MSRAGRARRLAAAAAFGGGGVTVLGALGYGVLRVEAQMARRWIGQPFGAAGPVANGVYGDGDGDWDGDPLQLGMIGDSTADGLGADDAAGTPGAIIAAGLAAVSGRPVRLTNVAAVGAESSALPAQAQRLLTLVAAPDAVVVMVGANDVTHRVKPVDAVRSLSQAVTLLREAGAEVVVGTCPDLGTIEPIAPPLRQVARRSSRELAAAQTIAVVEAGGRTVSLGDLLGPDFRARPDEMFAADRYHPSTTGYSRVAAALMPSVFAALGHWPDGGAERAPDLHRGEGLAPVAQAAVAAAEEPGTEVAGTALAGAERGPRGRWATLLRRRRLPPLPPLPPLPQVPRVPRVPFARGTSSTDVTTAAEAAAAEATAND